MIVTSDTVKNKAHLDMLTFQGGEPAKFSTDGYIYEKNGSVYLEYQNGKDKSLIVMSESLVTLNKIGEENYTMVLQEGISTPSEIKTNAGNIRLSVFTHKIRTKVSHRCVEVLLVYGLKLGPSEVPTRLRIKCTF